MHRFMVNITPPNSSFLTEQEMANPNHAMCTYLRSMKYPGDWQGYAASSFRLKQHESSRWEWYLKQRPMASKGNIRHYRRRFDKHPANGRVPPRR